MKVFYGWRMVGAAACLQVLQGGLLLQSFGAYVALLSQEMGWSKTVLAGGSALQSIEGALLGPVLGWAIDRFGPRNLIRVGVGIFGLGFMALSQIHTITGFYVSIVLIAIGASCSGYFPLTIAVVHWFHRKRARALSTMSLGLAMGGLVVPVVGWMMQTYGWRTAAMASGAVIWLVGLPLSGMIRRTPEEMGEHVDGIAPEPAVAPGAALTGAAATADALVPTPAPAPPAPPEPSFTAAQALRTQAFWLLALGHGFALLVVAAVNVHAISHMKEGLGYTLAQASVVIMLLTAAQGAGMLLGAVVGDRWEKRYVAAACMLGHMFGLLLLTYATHPVHVGAFALLHGMAWGLRGPFMQAIRADYFGLQAIGMIMGLSAFIIAVGQAAGPLVAGIFADATGHYRTGFTVLALIAGTGSVLFVMAKKPT